MLMCLCGLSLSNSQVHSFEASLCCADVVDAAGQLVVIELTRLLPSLA